jgi:hypothetical protein
MVDNLLHGINPSAQMNNHDPDYFSVRNESGDIIKKCTEISRISSNIKEIYQRCNHKHRDTVIHDFY